MDLVITPEPHFLPGYTGHCPQFRFRQGETFGKLSHKLLVDPCANHAPELIMTHPKNIKEYPMQKECDTHRYPIIPGYDGFVPNLPSKIGQRYMTAVTSGMDDHEALMELFRRERRNLKHRDLLESGGGLFEKKLSERLMPMSNYRAPLIKVRPRAQAMKLVECPHIEKKQPYSKFTVPHFMEDADKEKYIVNGYGGHIPNAMSRFAQSSKQLTNSALCEFTNNYHHRRSAEWCPYLPPLSGTCLNTGQFVIYHRNIGLVPSYSGHVPGEAFTFGRTYGHATVNAKNFLARNKD